MYKEKISSSYQPLGEIITLFLYLRLLHTHTTLYHLYCVGISYLKQSNGTGQSVVNRT